MTMRLKAAYNPGSLKRGVAIKIAIRISSEGMIQAIHPENAVRRGDCPICTVNFSKSMNFVTAAYIISKMKRAQIISRKSFFFMALCAWDPIHSKILLHTFKSEKAAESV